MPARLPSPLLARRSARNQRLAWLIVLMLAVGMVLLIRYAETPRPAPPSVPAPPAPTVPSPPTAPTAPPAPTSPPTNAPPAQPASPPASRPAAPTIAPSQATTPRAYRKDAAQHLYAKNAARIYKGKLQPLLYAIGVLKVSIDKHGKVRSLHWMRAPRHAPEVMREIERTVRAAAPYPAPVRMGSVVYTDTWLWDKSGKFQLDTLTEGQL